jgi:serine/threonine protein kinase
MRKTRKRKGKTQEKKMQQKGGKIIGKGMSGVVHYPALQCKIPNENPTDISSYVSKVSSKKSAEKEFKNTEALRALKGSEEFAIYPEFMCEYNEKQNLLFSKFGGYSLVNYYLFLENLAYTKNADKSQFNEEYFNDIFKGLEVLKEKMKWLNENNIYHNDISFDNVLYNEETKKVYLIDFEDRGKSRNDTKGVQSLLDDLEDFKKRIN